MFFTNKYFTRVNLLLFAFLMLSNVTTAKIIKLDEYATDVSGKVWRFKGWVDVCLTCIPPKIEHWDVWLWDPYNNKWYHFTGRIVNGNPPSTDETNCIDNAVLGDEGYTINIVDENGTHYSLTHFNQNILSLLQISVNQTCD